MADDIEKLILSISADTAQMKRALDRVQKDVDRSTKGIEKEFADAGAKMGTAFDSSATRINRSFTVIEGGARRAGTNVAQSVGSIRAATTNLSFQLNDIATQLASGTSPFQVMAQQGGQVVQALTGAGGVLGALRIVGAAALNPFTLATVAITTLAGVATAYFRDSSKSVEESNKKMEEHRASIKAALDAWQGAPPAELIAYNNELEKLANLEKQRAGLREFIDSSLKPLDVAAGNLREAFDELFGRLQARNADPILLGNLQRDFERITKAVEENRATVADLEPLYNRLKEAETALGTTRGFDQMRAAITNMISLVQSLNSELKSTRELEANLGKTTQVFSPLGTLGPIQSQGGDFRFPATDLSDWDETAVRFGKTAADEFSSVVGDTVNRYVDQVVKSESGGNASAKNPLSSATGLGQFIESTWLRLFKENFPVAAQGMTDQAILEYRTNADASRKLIEAYARENAAILQRAGVAVNEAALHLAHFLGPQGAASVLKAAPNTPVSQLLSPGAIAANPSILGNGATAGSVVAYGQRRAGVAGPELDVATVQQATDAWAGLRNETQQTALVTQQVGQEYSVLQSVGVTALNGLKNALADGKIEGKELLGIMIDIVQQLLTAQQTAGGFSFGGGGGVGGGGGLLGGIGSLVGSLFGFEKGGIAKNGRPVPLRRFAGGGITRSAAIFGEAGPEAAVPLPDGQSIPVSFTNMPKMPRAASGPQRIELIVRAEEGEMFRPTVQAEARGVAVNVTQAGINRYDKQMPGRVNEVMERQGRG